MKSIQPYNSMKLENNVANPKKLRKPTTSVTVVNTMDDD